MNKPLLLLLLLLSAGAIWWSFRWDAPVRTAIVAAQGKNWKNSADARFHGMVRRYGDWPWLMVAGAAGAALAWRLNRRDWTRILLAAMLASTIAGIVANTSRLTTGRTRPRESPKIAQGFYGPWHENRLTIGNSKYNSFPSGHTATAFGFAGVIFFASFWPGLAALAVATLIAWSSIAIGAHHPSDVMVSFLLSMAIAWITGRLVKKHGDAIEDWLRRKFARSA